MATVLRRILVGVGKQARRVIRPHTLDLGAVKRICIFKIGAIGDVLMSTPMVHALRQRFPKARIDYWTGQWSAPVLAGNHDLDKVIAFDDAAFYKKRPDLVLTLARQVAAQQYDLMLLLDKHWSLGVFGRLCRVPMRIGFDREGEGFAHTIAVPYGPVKHEIEYYLDLAKAAGARPVMRPKLELTVSAKDHGFAKAFFKKHRLNPQKTIGIVAGGARNPGQQMAIRRWPVERFAEVARALAQAGWQLVLIGKSPGDDDVLPALQRAVPQAVNAIGNFTLHRSSALLKLCRLVICNDSGPMHLAAAVRTPTISIFGATDPHRKAPLGQNHRWLWKPVDCTRAEMYGVYAEPRLLKNILKVQPKHVLTAVRQLVRPR
jgi:lipopolysaccharide heptosyltransferase II